MKEPCVRWLGEIPEHRETQKLKSAVAFSSEGKCSTSGAQSLEELLPWLYLKGISTGDVQETLTVLLGREAPGLSASTISRLKRGVEGRASALVAAGFVEPALCVSLGRWHSFRGTAGGCGAVHSGGDRGYGGRQEGVAGVG